MRAPVATQHSAQRAGWPARPFDFAQGRPPRYPLLLLFRASKWPAGTPAVHPMHKGRLEAFSDGVIAILITIMVLELRVPKGASVTDLRPMLPVLCGYALSFVFLAIYWNNHHHMFQVVERVSGSVLWANAHLLFWLSLVPFTTAWMGQYAWAPWPIALYGVNLLLCAIAYYILAHALLAHHAKDSALAQAIGDDFKGKISLVPYIVSIPLAFSYPILSYACFVAVAILWLVPDKRMERAMQKHGGHHAGA